MIWIVRATQVTALYTLACIGIVGAAWLLLEAMVRISEILRGFIL